MQTARLFCCLSLAAPSWAWAQGRVADAGQAARDILRNPIYRDPGPADRPNWLADAFRELGRWLEQIIDWLLGRLDFGGPNVGGMGLGWLKPIIVALLAAAVVGLLVFLVLQFRLYKRRKRAGGGLMEEDEPDRTADEWLVRADQLTSEGRLREAVRCLYLACLMRLDDAHVTRFNRHETNWEHLRRFDASPRKPSGLDFRTPTGKFDRIWYGHLIDGPDDVSWFRSYYEDLWRRLRA